MIEGSARPRVHGVALEVTAHCQQRCSYCYNAWREDNGAGLAGEGKRLFDRVRKLLGALEVDHVTVTGGEPFARRDLFGLLDLVLAQGVGVQIVSNGGLVDDVVAARIAPLGVRFVQVTLDGPSADLHEAHVGAGHFAPTVRGIRALVRAGVPVVGTVVITRKNAERVGDTLGVLRDLGASSIALSRFSPAGYATRNVAELLPSRGDLLVAFRQALPHAREGLPVTSTMPVPPCVVEVEDLEPIAFGSCPIGTEMQEFALGPDGRLRHCTLHGRALGPDILDEGVDVAALVRGHEVAAYRRTAPAFCEGCVHVSSCGGGCGAAAEWVLGARRHLDPVVAQHVDDAFAARLREARRAVRRLEVIA